MLELLHSIQQCIAIDRIATYETIELDYTSYNLLLQELGRIEIGSEVPSNTKIIQLVLRSGHRYFIENNNLMNSFSITFK